MPAAPDLVLDGPVQDLPQKLPVMSAPSHGKGMLLRGGIIGHRGAGGRPANAARAVFTKSYTKRLKILEAMADDSKLPARDRIAAIHEIGRFSELAAEKVAAATPQIGPILLIENAS